MAIDEPKMKTVQAAILRLLRPLVRLLLRNGVPFRTFADLAKWVYVDVGSREFPIPGKKLSNSRISIITGLSRKEVLRLKKMAEPVDDAAVESYNRAARVIGGWVRDPRFTDDKGDPAALPIDSGTNSFTDLVKKYSGDIPARAILDELRNVGAVEIKGKETVSLKERAYIPRGDQAMKLAILGTDVSDLISTINHNLRETGGRLYFQRKVAYDNIPAETVEAFRNTSSREGQQLLEKLDRWLSRKDRDLNPSIGGTGRKRIGMGVYYFEENMDDKDNGGQP
jgi:hypothetical protein